MMRPRRHEDVEYPLFLGIGMAQQLHDSEEHDRPAGRLLLPDPESRHGWREYYVPKANAKPRCRPIGFGR